MLKLLRAKQQPMAATTAIQMMTPGQGLCCKLQPRQDTRRSGRGLRREAEVWSQNQTEVKPAAATTHTLCEHLAAL